MPNSTPFGMLFEEVAPPPTRATVVPIYSPSDGLSYIVAPDGIMTPFILSTTSLASTQTITEVKTETPDSDPTTETATKARAEINE
jgi:hypothetical protein